MKFFIFAERTPTGTKESALKIICEKMKKPLDTVKKM